MSETVQLHDKKFKPFIEEQAIKQAVRVIADNMNKDLKEKNPLFIIVLNGAFMFASDLFKHLKMDCEVSFVKLSSYEGTKSTSVVREVIGLDQDVTGRTIVVVEDIIDTGITMKHTIHTLSKMNAAEVKIASLLFKPNAFKEDYKIDYVGLEIANDFIVGYGLDYDGLGRNLPKIYKIIE
jgi:hypoxanthine phosphoribosyltransferase